MSESWSWSSDTWSSDRCSQCLRMFRVEQFRIRSGMMILCEHCLVWAPTHEELFTETVGLTHEDWLAWILTTQGASVDGWHRWNLDPVFSSVLNRHDAWVFREEA